MQSLFNSKKTKNELDLSKCKLIGGRFVPVKTLGEGKFGKVMLSFDIKEERKVAVKMMKTDTGSYIAKSKENDEIVANSMLKHPNIVDMICWQDNATYTSPNKTDTKVDYIAFEFAENGELFDFLSETGPFSEDQARYFFDQLINGIDYCHK